MNFKPFLYDFKNTFIHNADFEFTNINKANSLQIFEGIPSVLMFNSNLPESDYEYGERKVKIINVSENVSFENEFLFRTPYEEITIKLHALLEELAKKTDILLGEFFAKNSGGSSEIKTFHSIKKKFSDDLRGKNVSFTRSNMKMPYLQREIMLQITESESKTEVIFSVNFGFVF